jgi:hypothetical protein
MKNPFLALLVCVAACGGSNQTTTGGDLGGAAACASSQSCGSGESCCITNYFLGTASSTCAASCTDPAISVQCSDASQCGGNRCCMTTKAGYATNVYCGTSPTDCSPMFGGGMGLTHTCQTNSDCADSTNFPDCCQSPGGTMVHLCFNKNLLALNPAGTVVCP